MKTLIIILILLTSCMRYSYNLQTPCKKDKSIILDEITNKLINEGFEITHINEKFGNLTAKTMPDYSVWTGYTTFYTWNININKDTINAFCRFVGSKTNAFGATTSGWNNYLNDRAKVPEYLILRNYFKTICGFKTIILKKEIGLL